MKNDTIFKDFEFDNLINNVNAYDDALLTEEIDIETKNNLLYYSNIGTPDLWGRINNGIDVEIKNRKKISPFKVIYRCLGTAAAVLICIFVFKNINGVSNNSSLYKEDSGAIDQNEDYQMSDESISFEETAESESETPNKELNSGGFAGEMSDDNIADVSNATYNWQANDFDIDNCDMIVDGYIFIERDAYLLDNYEIYVDNIGLLKKNKIKLILPEDFEEIMIKNNMYGRFYLKEITAYDDYFEGVLTKIE